MDAGATIADYTAGECTPDGNPFRLEQCPGCGYSLAGLPAVGTCPECGDGYDRETVELTGVACGTHVTNANMSPDELRGSYRRGAFIAAAVCMAAAAYLLATESAEANGWVLTLVVLLSWGPSMVALARRLASGRAAVRLRMNMAGLVQDDDADEPTPLRAARSTLPWALLTGGAASVTYGIATGNWWWVFLTLILGVYPLCHWADHARIRRIVLRLPDGPRLMPHARRPLLRPRPWAHVETFAVEPTAHSEFWRIRATAKKTLVQDAGDVVDIEVPLTDEEAAALRARVRSWTEYWRNRPD